ncbi:hypothetical protein ACHAPU_009138 [Fusarium lateritium]
MDENSDADEGEDKSLDQDDGTHDGSFTSSVEVRRNDNFEHIESHSASDDEQRVLSSLGSAAGIDGSASNNSRDLYIRRVDDIPKVLDTFRQDRTRLTKLGEDLAVEEKALQSFTDSIAALDVEIRSVRVTNTNDKNNS